MRHGAERRGGRRRIARTGARAALRRRPLGPGHPLGRQRSKHGRVYEVVLSTPSGHSEQSTGLAARDERSSASLSPPVLLGAFRPGWQALPDLGGASQAFSWGPIFPGLFFHPIVTERRTPARMPLADFCQLANWKGRRRWYSGVERPGGSNRVDGRAVAQSHLIRGEDRF